MQGAKGINGGALNLTGILSGTGPVTVNSGAALSGTGTANGPVTVASGGAIAPGVSGECRNFKAAANPEGFLVGVPVDVEDRVV